MHAVLRILIYVFMPETPNQALCCSKPCCTVPEMKTIADVWVVKPWHLLNMADAQRMTQVAYQT